MANIILNDTNRALFEHITLLGTTLGAQAVWGHTISYAEIENITGVLHEITIVETNEVITNPSFYSMISSVNRQLTKYHLRLKNIAGFGYKILHPNEYAEVAFEQFMKAHGNVSEAKFILDNTDTQYLTPAELVTYQEIYDKVSDTDAYMRTKYKP